MTRFLITLAAVFLFSAIFSGGGSAESPSSIPIAATDGWLPGDFVDAAQVRTREDLEQLAAQMAKHPMTPRATAPMSLQSLTYDQYLQIQFKHEYSIGGKEDLPFVLETFHQGFVQKDRVLIFEQVPDAQSNQTRNRMVRFDPSVFDYGGLQIPADDLLLAGHAGLKIAGRFEAGGDLQEMLTFLGSSYFRARTGDTVYGSSTRGLAVNIGLPVDEEFPLFRAFWVTRPADDAKQLRILALLDSSQCTGAYEFHLNPGESQTTIDVAAKIYVRNDIDKIAIAPLTSMWMWGDGQPPPSLDNRPQVHDAAALLIQPAGEAAIYRPFARIEYPSITQFPVEELDGFGVIQRDRNFENYLDSNAHYERRPSLFVRPDESWIGGTVELLEIPGAHEGVDNIGVYWIPPEPAVAGSEFNFAYQLNVTSGEAQPAAPDGGEPMPARLAKIQSFDVERLDETVNLSIVLSGDELENLDPAEVQMQVKTVRAELLEQSIEESEDGQWIASLSLMPTEDAPAEIRVEFSQDERPVAETFAYLCPQSHPRFVFPAVYTKVE